METTWLTQNEKLGPEVLALIVSEAQRTQFSGEIPPAFSVLEGTFVDLGFEDLGLPDDRVSAIRRAFCHTGVRVPDTNFRLRNLRGLISAVEPADGTETEELPENWREAVVRLNGDKVDFIGKRVRKERLGPVDLSQYKDIGVGWVPRPPIVPLTEQQRDFLDRYYIENLNLEPRYAFSVAREHGFTYQHMARLWPSYWDTVEHGDYPGIPPLSPPPDSPVFPWASIQELEALLEAEEKDGKDVAGTQPT